MESADPARLADVLRQRGIALAKGLSDAEVDRVQSTYDFQFPPDLRELLQHALPTGQGFPNWRNGSDAVIRTYLSWPAEGICFDVEENAFWMEGWGPRPAHTSEALVIAKQETSKAPMLIPIYGHRYIPDEPHLSGNPVFSVYQTDIIYYGNDLAHYFANEFWPGKYTWTEEHERSVRKIRFWSRLVDLNNGL
jgi:hypothetical protein